VRHNPHNRKENTIRLHFLQHVALETPGSILDWAAECGHHVTGTRLFDGETLPQPGGFDWLVIMGGPMNIYEEAEYSWLAAEKLLILQSIDAGKVVLGFCLGGQLVADAIGGAVTANPEPEIGWIPITWNAEAKRDPLFAFFPDDPVVFQWHYDTFSTLPPDAEVLASSAACACQAFRYRERVFGFQFHMENTSDMLLAYTTEFGAEMVPATWVQSPAEVMAYPEHVETNNRWMAEFMTRLERQERGSDL
jgi:GMP synthase-like glutamine amidotransferase